MPHSYAANDEPWAHERGEGGTNDLPLFDQPVPYAKDSDTSREAAEHVHLEAAKQRRLVLVAFREHGPMTPDEAAARLEQSVLAIRPRCTELRQSGFLEFTGERRQNTSGMWANVLRSVKGGSDAGS